MLSTGLFNVDSVYMYVIILMSIYAMLGEMTTVSKYIIIAGARSWQRLCPEVRWLSNWFSDGVLKCDGVR